MSFLLATVKLAALAVVLLCLSSLGPGLLLAGAEQPAKKSAPAALHCRMYFGCAPLER